MQFRPYPLCRYVEHGPNIRRYTDLNSALSHMAIILHVNLSGRSGGLTFLHPTMKACGCEDSRREAIFMFPLYATATSVLTLYDRVLPVIVAGVHIQMVVVDLPTSD